MTTIEERNKLSAKWAQLFDDKAAIEAEAFARWEASFNGLTPEQTRLRYLTKRIFTAEEQTRLDAIVKSIENIGETLKVLDHAISRDEAKTRERIVLAPGRNTRLSLDTEYRSKW